MSLKLTTSAASLALLAVLAAGCGTAAATHHAAPNPAAPAHHHAGQMHAANPIPQGNAGDQDADNNGGPSDGDGNI